MKHPRALSAKKKDSLMTAVLVGVFLLGLAILLYPTVSDRWNRRVTTRAIAAYDSAVGEMDETD